MTPLEYWVAAVLAGLYAAAMVTAELMSDKGDR